MMIDGLPSGGSGSYNRDPVITTLWHFDMNLPAVAVLIVFQDVENNKRPALGFAS